MCYVKSGKSAADIAAAAAASANSDGTPASADTFAFPDLFNLGSDAFGMGDGLNKWNFGELLNGVSASDPTIAASEFPLFVDNSFLNKWYGADANGSPSEMSDAATNGSPSAAPQIFTSPNYNAVSSSSSPTLVTANSSAMLVSPSLDPTNVPGTVPAVNYFPQLASASSDVNLAPFLQFAPVFTPSANAAPVYPSPPTVPVVEALPVKKQVSPSPPVVVELLHKPVKRSHPHDEQHTSGSDDPMAAKRQKNTEAARRSRQRKVEMMETLQGQVADLQGENSRLNVRLAVIESEREQWIAKENELMERIRNLERQLNESHMAVVSLGLKKATGAIVV